MHGATDGDYLALRLAVDEYEAYAQEVQGSNDRSAAAHKCTGGQTCRRETITERTECQVRANAGAYLAIIK